MAKRASRELAYALALPLLAGAGLAYLLIVLLGVVATANLVGVPLLALCVRGARGLGAVNRALAGALAGVRVPALADVAGWRALAHSLLRLPAALLGFGVAAGLWGGGLALLAAPLWRQPALLSPVGAAMLVLAPWAVHLALAPERWIAFTLLGPAPSAARIQALERTRALAVGDAAAELRRIERDLHDGTSARLVALAMSLDMIRDELGHPDRLGHARALADSAHHNAKETLTELRDLIRGIHPPALDKGLETALATLAARSPLPVTFAADLPVRPSPAIESIAYFCAAELLANATKHSGARQATIDVHTRGQRLDLRVRDDGSGGATAGAGSGLRGLQERVRIVDGTLDIRSPAGGPTVVTVDLPLHL
ncbi:sensor histidine kinase [Nonomuraea endophytica]|uniref:histidine kinase n=1 Tax=Nonomuraea endophytica TaxID=714136 RepID=A0A7W8A584_9ACTN|nr:histidine kinase [Nonomuraea endophytica]MBB5079100.1 signal transduction histidine kinase [Nonomuraea endophytica]